MKKNKEKKRLFYPKNFKKVFFYRLSKGESPENILKNNGFNVDELIKKDKKYIAKLIHKWKKDLLKENFEETKFDQQDLSSYSLIKEIETIGLKKEFDFLYDYYTQEIEKTKKEDVIELEKYLY